MVMHYPNGQPYRTKQLSLKKSPYPTATLYGNRGMTLEEEINESNQYYLKQGIAVIHKKPIPIKNPTAAGRNASFPICCDISIDGINKDQTDAATITPDANPKRAFCTGGFNSPF